MARTVAALAALLLLPGAAVSAPVGTLLFRSGFEDGVVLGPPFIRGGQQWQTILGTDSESGFSWSDLPGEILGFQPLLAPGSDALSRVQNWIVTAPGRSGLSTRVLLQVVLADDPEFPGTSRSNYLFRPDERMTDAVQSSWIFLQPNLREAMAGPGVTYNWRQVWEAKCALNDVGAPSFRTSVSIAYTPRLGLHWRVVGEHSPIEGKGEPEFGFVDEDIDVPAGRWFLFEVRLKQHPTEGRFTCRVDGQTLCDWSGKTMDESFVDKWNLVKLYTDPDKMGAVHWQYVDDVELRALP